MKRLVLDIDDTICTTLNGDYKNSVPNYDVIEKVKSYHQQGFEICFYTSRNVRTFQSNVGKINAHTLPIIIDWLNQYNIPYDEIYIGKPWCGFDGFYVDDKAIRPDEFVNLSYDEICKLIKK
ncbi:capsular biosynthesis protein [Acinetobacter sp. NIPH 1852]|uniref:capsular biosynthesis protein n=1 Tax=Acinetobacter sp. NIPH 1852 TaxID=2923428 RepID=UPI001F4B3802|nr:capsular biosynthesis protein [Acinetobacter sp. NIPH 1852]MCH7309440.1 capsular biosynthesis protein [Acinetobacter sp. NIPH 1852]